MAPHSTDQEWSLLGLEERQPGVLISVGEAVEYGKPTVDALKRYAQSLPQKRARILLHGHESDPLHEMLIVAPGMTIWPPLLNERPPQSWLMLEGRMAFIEYEPPGNIVRTLCLDAEGSMNPSFLRFTRTSWYTTVPLSSIVVYLETKPGPHVQTKFADWGPQSRDDPAAQALISALEALRSQS